MGIRSLDIEYTRDIKLAKAEAKAQYDAQKEDASNVAPAQTAPAPTQTESQTAEVSDIDNDIENLFE
jgi:hypothetical protein